MYQNISDRPIRTELLNFYSAFGIFSKSGPRVTGVDSVAMDLRHGEASLRLIQGKKLRQRSLRGQAPGSPSPKAREKSVALNLSLLIGTW